MRFFNKFSQAFYFQNLKNFSEERKDIEMFQEHECFNDTNGCNSLENLPNIYYPSDLIQNEIQMRYFAKSVT